MVKLVRLRKLISVVLIFSTILSVLPLDLPLAAVNDWYLRSNVVDKAWLASGDKNVVDKFIPLSKELANSLKTETASAAEDPDQLEYNISVGPVPGSTTASYRYIALFNPSTSTRSVVIKRLMIQTNATTTAAYQDLRVQRITTVSAGVFAITPANIPKKNVQSADSVLKIYHTNPTVTLAPNNTNAVLMAVVAPAAAGSLTGIKEIVFDTSEENLVLQPGQGITLHQTVAGDPDQKIRLNAEWEEVDFASTPAPQNEFMIAYPRVEIAAVAGYKYATFFNPATSTKTAIIKRLWLDVNADTTANYWDDIRIQRISGVVSGGTVIPVTDVPKMHSGSANSAMDFRRTGVTATLVGNTSSLMSVMPPGTAHQVHGHQMIAFRNGDEKIILQPGEGIAVTRINAGTAGDVDHLVRLSVKWQEVAVAATPAAQGEYMVSVGPVKGSAAAYNFATFFNPATSTKTAVIKRISIRVNASSTASYASMFVQRITAASAGTQITAPDIPKKHTGSPVSIMEVRHSGPVATLSGTDGLATIMGVQAAGTVGQIHGLQEIIFDGNEKLIIQPGQGIVLRQNAAGNINHQVRFLIEWGDQASTPSSQGEYITMLGPVSGSTSANNTYATFMNPATSTKTAVIKRLMMRVNAASSITAATAYKRISLRRITNSTAGTVLASTNINKKHTGTANSSMVLRYANGVAGTTYFGSTNAVLDTVITPGAVGSAVAPHLTGYNELIFNQNEPLVLKPGEGIGLNQEVAGDADFRVRLIVEWGEEAAPPGALGELMVSSPSVTGTTALGYVYASYFNPATSSKNYVIKRLGVRAMRISTAVNPTSVALSLRRIVSATNGKVVNTNDIPKKNTGTASSTVDMRYEGVTVGYSGVTESRVMNVTVPNAVGQLIGLQETYIINGDEMILAPGEGLAIYQETNAGDANTRFLFKMEWKEVDAAAGGETLTIGVTTGNQSTFLSSGDVGVFVNSSTCSSAANCSLFTAVGAGTVSLTSLKISEVGNVSASTTITNLDLYYDTTGTNGAKTLFGTAATFDNSDAATVSGSLSLTPGTTYYFYVQVDLVNGANDPPGGKLLDLQITDNADVISSGSVTGAPVAMLGNTAIKPKITGYTNSTEAGLNYSAGCTNCGARIGPSSTLKSNMVVLSGYGFGADPGIGSRDTATNKVEVGSKAITDSGAGNTNVTTWGNRSITFHTNTQVTGDDDTAWGANFGGAGALKLTVGGQAVSTTLNFNVLPQVLSTSVNTGVVDGAREYNSADADGVVTLNGTRFGTASTTGWARILGCDKLTCSSPSGSVTTTAWSNTAITFQVPPVISNYVYTGTITMQQGTGTNSLTTTYSNNAFRILPRITTTTLGGGMQVTISGDHLCQNIGVCPGAFSSANSVGFYNNVSATYFNYWYETEVRTDIPAGAESGNVVVTSSNYVSNGLNFTVPYITTLGTGSDPATSTIGPGAGATDTDLFTFQTNGGTEDITSVTVYLSQSSGIGRVSITDANDVELGFTTSPSFPYNVISVSGLTANTTLQTFKIRVTPRAHGAMTVPPGGEYPTITRVTDFYWGIGSNMHTGSDFPGPNTLTIDNYAPNNATAVGGSGGNGLVNLLWTTSNSADFFTTAGSVVLRWTGSSAGSEVPVEGSAYTAGNTIGTATVACAVSSAANTALNKIDGTGGSADCTTAALTNGQAYAYKVFQRDIYSNYNVGTLIGTFTPSGNPPVITSVTSTAISTSSASITWLTADQPSTSQVQYNTNGTFGDCAGDCTVLDETLHNSHDVSLSGMVTGTTYYFRVRSKGADGSESISTVDNFKTLSSTPTGYPPSGDLISAVFDTSASSYAAYNSIMWKGTANGGRVRFQLATASNSTGPWTFYGGVTCGTDDWFDPGNPDTPIELKCPVFNNNRFFKYKVELCSQDCATGGGASTPVVDDVVVNWSP